MVPAAKLQAPALFLSEVGVIIPAWQPTMLLVSLARDLLSRGFTTLLIIDDGSGAEAQPVFEAIAALSGTEVLRHRVNQGKGRALKTAFSHLLAHRPNLRGVVTADADGQHAAEDIQRVAEALLAEKDRMILGRRSFDQSVPARSRFGNRLTRQVFALLTGVRFHDTQTGLRGLPTPLLHELLSLPGERYEYEMTMLAHLCRTRRFPLEVPIATIYLKGNGNSHFNPVWDSLRIYFALVRYMCRRRS